MPLLGSSKGAAQLTKSFWAMKAGEVIKLGGLKSTIFTAFALKRFARLHTPFPEMLVQF